MSKVNKYLVVCNDMRDMSHTFDFTVAYFKPTIDRIDKRTMTIYFKHGDLTIRFCPRSSENKASQGFRGVILVSDSFRKNLEEIHKR